LPAAGRRFQAAGHLGMKADAATPQCHCRSSRFFLRDDGAAVAARAAVNPVIKAPLQTVDELLDVRQVKAGGKGTLLVGLAVAVSVLAIDDVRRVGDNQATLPRHDASRKTQPRNKGGGPFVKAVAVAVFQELNATRDDLAGADALVGVADHLGDVEPAVL